MSARKHWIVQVPTICFYGSEQPGTISRTLSVRRGGLVRRPVASNTSMPPRASRNRRPRPLDHDQPHQLAPTLLHLALGATRFRLAG